jgi:hypothetical protein
MGDQKPKGPHQREPWGDADPKEIIVHCRYDIIKGTSGALSPSLNEEYIRAKYNFDIAAATNIVERAVNPQKINELIDLLIKFNKKPLIVVPHPQFDEENNDTNPASPMPTNALPFAFGNRLGKELGCDVDSAIIEVARPGRTKLSLFGRFLWQPKFDGKVSHTHGYVLADDVCALSGTLAALRSHIVQNGGTVIAATTLGHNHGVNQKFPIAVQTENVLKSLYTPQIDGLWREEIGHEIRLLTENEGIRLVEWASSQRVAAGHPTSVLQLLRDRLLEAAAKGR